MLRLNRVEVALLGAVLAGLQVAQSLLPLATYVHTTATILFSVTAAIGIGVSAAKGIAALVPAAVAHVLGLLLVIGLAVQQGAADIPATAHAVINAAATFLLALGFTPYVPPQDPPPVPRAGRPARRVG